MLILYKLARNTFIECIREPVYFLMLISAIIMTGLFPTASAMVFAQAVELIRTGIPEVVVYNGLWSKSPAVCVLRCIG